MGIHLKVVNFDQYYQRVNRKGLLVNNLNSTNVNDRETINSLIYSRQNGEVLSTVPSCECGETTDADVMGEICHICGTPVEDVNTAVLEPILWLKQPVGCEKIISPLFLTMLMRRFTKSKFKIIEWLCDTRYTTSAQTPDLVYALEVFLKEKSIPRGYNSFVKNFDVLMHFMLNYKRGKKQVEPLEDFIAEFKDDLFSSVLPLPNRSILILVDTAVGLFSEKVIPQAVNAIRMMVGIDIRYPIVPGSSSNKRIIHNKQERLFRSLLRIAEYHEVYERENLLGKPGLIRKHIGTGRVNFCARNVISSLTEDYDYECVELPWASGVTIFRYHLMNLLRQEGYTLDHNLQLLDDYAMQYHPLIDKLFKRLIEESPFTGPPVTFHRNPTLERGSAQLMYIGKVKTNVEDHTIGLPIIDVRGFNADYLLVCLISDSQVNSFN